MRILVRGVPAADIVPIGEEPAGWTADLAELERRGSIRRGKAGAAKELLEAGPKVASGALARALDSDRDERVVVASAPKPKPKPTRGRRRAGASG